MKIVAIVLMVWVLVDPGTCQPEQCEPEVNCNLPDCRCWNDRSIPGNIPVGNVPQVILVTFQYTVNGANVDNYNFLFQGATNPNNCPTVGTFFVQETNSDMGVIKELADYGHEIGVTSIDGTSPETGPEWRNNLAEVKKALEDAGIQQSKVVGVRAPDLEPGGLAQFTAMAQENFQYDASCTTSEFDEQDTLLWPFTYQFAPGPKCTVGEGPEESFPDRWQVMVADLQFNGTKCATPSACTDVVTERNAFDLFYNSFEKHYQGSRSPYMLVINPDWIMNDAKREGTREFLEYVRAAFEDTWILSVNQALQWVRDPVPNANATDDYPPWEC